MRGGGDWLPLFWLLIGGLLLIGAWSRLRPWLRRQRQRKAAPDLPPEEAGWIRHSHSKN